MKIFQEIAAIEKRGEMAAYCVIVSTTGSTPRRVGSKMIVYADGRSSGSIGGGEKEKYIVTQALEAIREGIPRLVRYPNSETQDVSLVETYGQVEVYVEPIIPQAMVLVIGIGHIGKAVAKIAKYLGYRVVVCDDREGYATKEQIPEADFYHTGEISQLLKEIDIHNHTYILLTTRNVDVDMEILPTILQTSPAYIGVIGSKHRWEITQQKLLDMGVEKRSLKRIISPIGLDLGAEIPEEIALSIMAEIVMLKNGGKGGRMVELRNYKKKRASAKSNRTAG
ncbi:MAG: XdhC/CoxI family protein [Anaerolineales bacterium]|jgi:xanthine dehydrogenase accessory factor